MEFLQNIDIATIAIQFVVLLFSLSIHEASHAWMSDYFGDYTARYLGRVTLNPVPHIDPVGTILFPILMFFTSIPLIGWAKPVPVNPAHLRHPRKDNVYIALAGPASNLLTGFVAFLILLVINKLNPGLLRTAYYGLPGSDSIATPIILVLFYLFFINWALALFNCIPIPPLDGHWILYGLLPESKAAILERLGGYGFLIIYALMFMGILGYILMPVYFMRNLLLSS